MPEEKFLVVRLGSLGDIVHTFPAVAGLRASFPAAEIVWLTHPRWANLVSTSGLSTEIWPMESRDFSSVRETTARIRSHRWTASIDYQGLWKSAFPPILGGVSRRIGFSSKTIREFGVPVLYTDRVETKTEHIADQNGELTLRTGAAQAVGRVNLNVSVTDIENVRHDLARQRVEDYVALCPGGGWISKCWPAERYGALCERIRSELGLPCVINYGPGEESLFAAVKAASGSAEPVGYFGNIGALMALLRAARCVVGGDTGPLHLGVAVGTRAVALFGPTDPARNGPNPPDDQIVLRGAGALTTYRRGDTTDPSLLKLSVEEAFQAVRRRLEAPA
jgi:heptosyltransferase I